MDKDNCSILVSSWENSADIWEPFFILLFKYWSDCPFKIYLISGTKVYPDSRVNMILLGEDKKYATNLKTALEKIDTPYILYLHEDYFLQSKVDNKRVLDLLDLLIRENAAYIKLFPSPPPKDRFQGFKDIAEVKKGNSYSISHQAAIWNKKILESLIIPGETGWDMEVNGGSRTLGLKEPFLATFDTVLDYPKATAVKKGILMYDALKLCEQEGIKLNLNPNRKVETRWEYFFRTSGLRNVLNRLKNILLLPRKILRGYQSSRT